MVDLAAVEMEIMVLLKESLEMVEGIQIEGLEMVEDHQMEDMEVEAMDHQVGREA
jgi:hypothetical protein